MSQLVLTKTLDDELVALLAGEADECPACGEALAREGAVLACASCGSRLGNAPDLRVQFVSQAG